MSDSKDNRDGFLSVSEDHWYTCRHGGSIMTFRLCVEEQERKDGGDHHVHVDCNAFLDSIAARLPKQLSIDTMKERSDDWVARMKAAAVLAYRNVPVYVSLMDDPSAIPQDLDLDAAVDLWAPMHLALVMEHKAAVEALIAFHQANAVSILDALVKETTAPLFSDAENEEEEEEDNTHTREGASDGSGDYEKGESGTTAKAKEEEEAVAGVKSASAHRQLVECDVRHELANSVTLLGHFYGISSRSSATRYSGTLSQQQHLHRDPLDCSSGSGYGPSSTANNTNNCSNSLANTLTATSVQDVISEAYARRNTRQTAEEEALLADTGGEFCIANVTDALKSLIVSAVHQITLCKVGELSALAMKETFISRVMRRVCDTFLDNPRRPSLIVDSATMYDLCGGDIDLLSRLLDMFEGSLGPIFRGKKLVIEGEGRGAGASRRSPAMTPSLMPVSRASSGVSLSTPRGQSISRHGNAPSSASQSPQQPREPIEPFWFSCAAQDSQRVAFYATWMNIREQVIEKPGSARLRRATIMNEYRITHGNLRRLREVSAMPPASVWSGHMFVIMKLLSRECSVENFMDCIDGGYLSALSNVSIPGTFIALTTAGAVAAAVGLKDPSATRKLTQKLETLLVEVPGRASPLRPYLTSRPNTHAARFEELWLGQTLFTEPKKFKTRVEMLFFVVVEIVLLSAEKMWAPQTPPRPAFADKKRADDAQAALEGWISVWKAFFIGLRERPTGTHSRSVSRSGTAANSPFVGPMRSTSPVSNTPKHGAGTTSTVTIPEIKLSMEGAAAAASTQAASGGGIIAVSQTKEKDAAGTTGAPDEAQEFLDAVRRLCEALPLRLQHGKPPLPAIHRSLYDPAKGSDKECSSALNTPQRSDKSLPVPSLDSEFAYIRQLFADNVASESNETKLKFYGLYKQATEGDINIPKPWIMDQVGRAKWNAWNEHKGMSLTDAKRMYINEYKAMKEMRGGK